MYFGIDTKHGGDTFAVHGALPTALTAKPKSSGLHYYFRYRLHVRNRATLGSHVDVSGDGGYVIMAIVPEIVSLCRQISEQEHDPSNEREHRILDS